MHRAGATNSSANVFRGLFPVVLLLCLSVSGCGNSCFTGFFNGNGGGGVGVSTGNTTCPLNTTPARVFSQIRAAAAPPNSSASFPTPLVSPRPSPNDIQHIFVTLRGIEAHPGVVADSDSSGWQQLAPDLAAHPAQFDLLSVSADSPSSALSASATFSATILADEYRQLRLRLVPVRPSPDDLLPETNACGSVAWNCIVFADGSVRPLQFDASASEFLILAQHGSPTLFRVLPGEVIHLSIEFDPSSSVLFSSTAAVRFVPAFKVVSRSALPLSDTQ